MMKTALLYFWGLIGGVYLVETPITTITANNELVAENKPKADTSKQKQVVESKKEVEESIDLDGITTAQGVASEPIETQVIELPKTVERNISLDTGVKVNSVDKIILAKQFASLKSDKIKKDNNSSNEIYPNLEDHFEIKDDIEFIQVGIWKGTNFSLSNLKSKLFFSNGHPDKGFYGHLKLLYSQNSYKSSVGQDRDQTGLTPEIKLGYLGTIYSPRLLDYKLEGILRYETFKNTYGDLEDKTTINSTDYLLNLNFIKDTILPFTLFAQKTDRPVSTIYLDTTIEYSQNVNNYGVTGNIRLKYFTIDYGATSEENIREGLATSENTQIDRYHASIRHSNSFHNFQLSYTHEERLTDTISADNNRTIDDTDDTINISYRAKLSKDFTFNSSARYSESGYYNMNMADARMSLQWRPKTKHNASLSASTSLTDTYTDSNGTQTTTNSTSSLNLNQSYNYRATKELSFAQSLGLYTYDSDRSKGETTNAVVGVSYNANIKQDTKVGAKANINTRISKTQSIAQTGEERLIKRDFYAFDASLSISERLPSLFSTLNMYGSYYSSSSSLNETRDNININIGLNTTTWGGFRNSIYGSYTKSEGVSYIDATDTALFSSITRFDIKENIAYTTRLNIKGKIITKAGIRYESIDNNKLVINRVVPNLDLNMNYRFFRRVNFIANAHISKDLSYNYTYYSTSAYLRYNVRKIDMSMGYKYYKTESKSDTGFELNTQNNRFEIKIIRNF